MKLLRFLLVVGAVAGAAFSARPSYAAVGEDVTAPTCTIEAFSPYTTVYPRVDDYRDTVFMDYSVTDDLAVELKVQLLVVIPDGSATIVRTGPEELVSNPGSGTVVWNGRDDDGNLVPEGLYAFTLQVMDEAGNLSYECQKGVTVNHAKLTRTTFKQSISASGSQLDKLVGNCSVLRKPSLRGWEGSLGYYSNKRCNDGFNKSRVGTANGMIVPEAFKNRYHSLQIKLYGGAAKARPGSQAGLLYFKRDLDADATLLRLMGPQLGTHAGAKTSNAANFVRREEEGDERPYVAWLLIAVNGAHYDVKNFTVVLEYTGLIDPNDEAPRAAHRPLLTGSPRLLAGR